jgi:hypothetical protein
MGREPPSHPRLRLRPDKVDSVEKLPEQIPAATLESSFASWRNAVSVSRFALNRYCAPTMLRYRRECFSTQSVESGCSIYKDGL